MHQYKLKDVVEFKRSTLDNETGVVFKAGVQGFVSGIFANGMIQLDVPIGERDEVTQVHPEEVIPVYKKMAGARV